MNSTRLSSRLLAALLAAACVFTNSLLSADEPPAAPVPPPTSPRHSLADGPCEVGDCAQGVPLLSKIPYLSRLFTNVGAGQVGVKRIRILAGAVAVPTETVPATLSSATEDNPVQEDIPAPHGSAAPARSAQAQFTIELKESVNEQGVVGIEADVVDNRTAGSWQVRAAQPGYTAGVQTPAAATTTCTANRCAETCNGPCAPVLSVDPSAKCACGADCPCCATLAGNCPLKWFGFHGPQVKLPTLTDVPCFVAAAPPVPRAHHAAVVIPHVSYVPHAAFGPYGPHGPFVAHGPHAPLPPPGIPFHAVHEELVTALIENAALKGREEAREELLDQLVEAMVEKAKLEAQTELLAEVIEMKEQHTESVRELTEGVIELQTEHLGALVEMQQEHLAAITEAKIENARLQGQLELSQERQRMIEQLVAAQTELNRKATELTTRAAQVEQQLHAIEQVRAENATLKAKLAEVLDKSLGATGESRTAVLPKADADEKTTK